MVDKEEAEEGAPRLTRVAKEVAAAAAIGGDGEEEGLGGGGDGNGMGKRLCTPLRCRRIDKKGQMGR